MEPIELATPRIDPTAYVAATARLFGRVEVRARAVLMFGVVVRAELDDIVVGEETDLQDQVVVHADAGFPCLIGDRVHVGHAAVLHGATIGAHCLVGIGARILNGAVLGEGAWLAAGALLPEGKSIPPWTLAMGIPARPVRELTESEVARQAEGVAQYQRFAAAYRRLGV